MLTFEHGETSLKLNIWMIRVCNVILFRQAKRMKSHIRIRNEEKNS